MRLPDDDARDIGEEWIVDARHQQPDGMRGVAAQILSENIGLIVKLIHSLQHDVLRGLFFVSP